MILELHRTHAAEHIVLDAAIGWARERLPEGTAIRFARRTITRPIAAQRERQAVVGAAQLEAMRARGEFALYWRANGHRYGIGREILDWLAAGETVVVNGSRGHLREAITGAFRNSRSPAAGPSHRAGARVRVLICSKT